MQGRISKRGVDEVQPGVRDTFLWDTTLPGFGLKVTPAGRKVYVVQYRFRGRVRRYTIGVHGPVTPDQARQEATRILGLVASGQDPADARAQDQDRQTVAEILQRFVREHVETKTKDRTIHEYKRVVKKIILPALGKTGITEVGREDITRLHHSMKDTPYQANRVLAVLSKFFGWCEQHGYRPEHSNPCHLVQKYQERKRERFLGDAELSRLGAVLVDAETNGEITVFSAAAIRLLLLTGARLNEILTLRWSEVDFDRSALRLPDSKTGAKLIHLNPPAIEILQGLPREDGNPYVIQGRLHGAHMVNLQKPWQRVLAAAGLEGLRLHDLRHSFASVGAGAGLGLPLIGALLGHTQAATTARYAHLAADPVKQAGEVIALRIATMLGSKTPTP